MQIESQKLQWKVTSKVGSLENAHHTPKGGDKKVSLSTKLATGFSVAMVRVVFKSTSCRTCVREIRGKGGVRQREGERERELS